MTEESASAEMFYPAKEGEEPRIVTSDDNVTKAVRNLLGIDKNQFSQIVMLAQGDFMKLLFEGAKERQDIFRKLFKTEYFQRFQERLLENTKSVKQEYEMAYKGIRQRVESIACEPENKLYESVQQAKHEELPDMEITNIVEQLLSKDKDIYSALEYSFVETEKELDSVKELITKFEEKQKLLGRLHEKEKLYEENKTVFVQLKEECEKQLARKPEIEAAEREILSIESELEKYDKLESKQKRLIESQKNLSSAESSIKKIESEISVISENIEKLNAEINSLDDAGQNREKYVNELNTAEEIAKQLDELKLELKSLNKLKKELETAQKKYQLASDDTDILRTKYNLKNKAFLDEQAGILAASLKEGEKCPVCGSTSHPKLAKCSESAPSEAELKEMKSELEASEGNLDGLSKKAGELKAKAEVSDEKLQINAEKILAGYDRDRRESINEKISEKYTQNEKTISELESKVKEEEKRILRRQQLAKEIPEQQEKLKNRSEKLNGSKNSAVSFKTINAELTNEIDDIRSSLKFESKEKAVQYKKELIHMKNSIKEGIEKAEKLYRQCESKQNELGGEIQQLRSQQTESENIDIVSRRAEEKSLTEKRSNILSQQNEIHSRIAVNSDILKNIRHELKYYAELGEKYQWLKDLSDTANGRISGKDRVTLEVYVQMSYFNKVIERANSRFIVMTDGQYELKRRESSDDRRNKSGLELNVIDHYNGTERSVCTLSGGEAFMASLSLALGLSEEIQCSAGGIQLDTMFIDEGFGTLDEETLNQAMKAISNLAEGNRLVGIISHVAELKDRVDKQIIVRKEKSGGSYVEIVS